MCVKLFNSGLLFKLGLFFERSHASLIFLPISELLMISSFSFEPLWFGWSSLLCFVMSLSIKEERTPKDLIEGLAALR